MTAYLIESWDEISIGNKTWSITCKELDNILIETIEDLDMSATPEELISNCIIHQKEFYLTTGYLGYQYGHCLVEKMWYFI
jgi:hypothetical protein